MHDYKVKIASKTDSDKWNAFVQKSPDGTIFHEFEWLKILEKQTKSRLIPLVFYRGKTPFAQLPFFHSSFLGLNYLLSPPAGGLVGHLGPIFLIDNDKQSAIESIIKNFVRVLTNFIETGINRRINYVKINLKNYIDVRPFLWQGYEAIPSYTYNIDLSRESDKIMSSFSQSTRRYLKINLKENSNNVSLGGITEALEINNLVRKRYSEQGKRYDISDSYLLEIYDKFREKIDIFVFKEEGKLRTGLIILKTKDSICHWIGGTQSEAKTRDVPSLLHWSAMEKGKQDGLEWYDLFGANTEKLCINKSKFNPNLDISFNLIKKDSLGNLSDILYKKFKG